MPRTIYFSGSISGGRADADLYRQIVNRLESAGHRVFAGMVTASHVGPGGESLDPRVIFDRDMGWIGEVAKEKGILVAEVSMPSLGVGYEVATARYLHGMPVICLYRPAHTKRCSAMVAGDAGVRMLFYDDDLEEMLEKLLKTVDQLGE